MARDLKLASQNILWHAEFLVDPNSLCPSKTYIHTYIYIYTLTHTYRSSDVEIVIIIVVIIVIIIVIITKSLCK